MKQTEIGTLFIYEDALFENILPIKLNSPIYTNDCGSGPTLLCWKHADAD